MALGTKLSTIPGGFTFDQAAAAAHVMQPANTRGVISSRGLEEGIRLTPRRTPTGVTLALNTDGFVAGLNAALAASTAGYVMQLRQHGQPIASAQVNWAKRPSDGSESWGQSVRMHIASCSKLITAIAMTRTLAAHNLPPTTKIISYLPDYWTKGPNIDQITFAQLMTHTSGFRVSGSDMSYPTMKALIAGGVTSANLGQYSYQNTNFGICRILLPVMNGTIPASTVYPAPIEDQTWDYATITAYEAYVQQFLFQPAGVNGPTLTHPDPDALAYTFPPAGGWNSGDLTTESGGAGWHMSVDDLLDVMGCFRRQGTIMPPAAAQAMLDASFGIDLIETTNLGTLYNKNGLWADGSGQTEQSLAYFLPRDMELVVLANSPIGNPGKFFRDVVTNLYVDNIAPQIAVGGWIARHGLTAEQYQEAFNDYVGNQGMQLTDVSGYGSAVPLYAALWVKTASPPAWQARHGLTASDYQTTFNQLTAQGYHPVLVNGYATAAGPRFACIFEQGATGPWVAQHGLTAAQYQAAFDGYLGQGYALDWVSGYFDGSQDLYAAIWRKDASIPAWQARHGLTAEQYQAFFNEVTGQGYKPVVVCGYSDGAADRYAAIFRKIVAAPAWQARHGLTPAQYQTTFDQLVAQGYRLELVSGYSTGGQDHIAAIWTK
ncbi:MAG TPA: serine hydrolase [Bryobacteraceae bacterium]|nr:serine hydrolase [Bryobacteraceae bacterium]